MKSDSFSTARKLVVVKSTMKRRDHIYDSYDDVEYESGSLYERKVLTYFNEMSRTFDTRFFLTVDGYLLVRPKPTNGNRTTSAHIHLFVTFAKSQTNY